MQSVDDSSFGTEVLQSQQPVLVDFWAPWCAPCRAVAPVVERLAAELAGTVKVVKLNVDEAPETAQRYRVQSIPTLAVFVDGKLASQVQGAVPQAQIMALIDRAVPSLAPQKLSPADVEKAVRTGGVVVADLRSAAEYARNHIAGSVSAPLDPDHPESWTPPTLDGKTLILVDRTGAPSAALARALHKDHKSVAYLGGGIFEWEISGRRLTSE